MSNITRFAVKLKDNYYCDVSRPGNSLFSKVIWKAKLYSEKPTIVGYQRVVMISVTYREEPYKVE